MFDYFTPRCLFFWWGHLIGTIQQLVPSANGHQSSLLLDYWSKSALKDWPRELQQCVRNYLTLDGYQWLQLIAGTQMHSTPSPKWPPGNDWHDGNGTRHMNFQIKSPSWQGFFWEIRHTEKQAMTTRRWASASTNERRGVTTVVFPWPWRRVFRITSRNQSLRISQISQQKGNQFLPEVFSILQTTHLK